MSKIALRSFFAGGKGSRASKAISNPLNVSSSRTRTGDVSFSGDGPSIVSVVSPAPPEDWTSVYANDPDALPTLSWAWGNCVRRANSFRDVSCCFEFSDGVRAVLPLFEGGYGRGLLSRRWSPPPAWGFGGLASTSPLTAGHLREVLTWLQGLASATIEIRPNPLQAEIWRAALPNGWVSAERTAHVLELNGGFDRLWSERFKSDTRNRVRRAERAGLEVVTGADPELVTEFHGLLTQSFGRWAKKQHEPEILARWRGLRRDPLQKFLTMATDAPSIFKLWIARKEGQAVAAILVLRDHQAHYTRGAMIEEIAGPTYANYLLHTRAIEDACSAGCAHYHMGETGESQSLSQFKSRFGAVPVPYAVFRRERIPVTWMGGKVKSVIKRVIGFRDV